MRTHPTLVRVITHSGLVRRYALPPIQVWYKFYSLVLRRLRLTNYGGSPTPRVRSFLGHKHCMTHTTRLNLKFYFHIYSRDTSVPFLSCIDAFFVNKIIYNVHSKCMDNFQQKYMGCVPLLLCKFMRNILSFQHFYLSLILGQPDFSSPMLGC